MALQTYRRCQSFTNFFCSLTSFVFHYAVCCAPIDSISFSIQTQHSHVNSHYVLHAHAISKTRNSMCFGRHWSHFHSHFQLIREALQIKQPFDSHNSITVHPFPITTIGITIQKLNFFKPLLDLFQVSLRNTANYNVLLLLIESDSHLSSKGSS
jgi:hypothetical protein